MASVTDQVLVMSQKVEQVKATIYQAIHKEYSDLFPSKTQDDLLYAVKPIIKDIQNLEEKFENEIKPKVQAVTSQHKDLVVEYENTKVIVKLLETLCKCHKELSLNKNTALSSLVKSATHLNNVKEELKSVDQKDCDIKIFKVLRNEYISQESKLKISLEDLWDSIVVWNTSTSASWDTFEGHLKTSLKVDHSPTGVEVSMKQLISAMDIMSSLNIKLRSFSQKLFTYIIKPMSRFQNLRLDIHTDKTHVLRITKKTGNQKILKHGHVTLYKKILDLVVFLKKSVFAELYNQEVKADLVKVKAELYNEEEKVDLEKHEINPLNMIGSLIWKDISDMIIQDHLSNAVPNSNSQMEKFESTIQETVKFESELIKEGFIPESTDSLSKYIKEINVHFANKVCQDILSDARDFMLSEMHNTTEVNLKFDRASMSLEVENEGKVLDKKTKNMLAGLEAIDDEFLNVSVFAFPQCCISENTQRLLDFVYQTMIKATESPYPLANQIFYSCRDIFELYVNVVPIYHKENLKLPQLAALHYDNCMYLAHHCMTLGFQFRHSLPGRLNSSLASFVDYVPILRRCGTNCFLEQIRMQQRELLDMLIPCHDFRDCTENGESESIRRAFNQVIHHLTRVVKQWNKILPINIFKTSIGLLLNTVLENILSSLFKMEDISVDDSGELHALFTILIDRTPEIIQSCSNEIVATGINDQVKTWKKFVCMVKVLEASLEEVVDMWNQGKGELSMCMTDGEVRYLMRALFKNTDRRAHALAKIKHQIETS